MKRVIFAVKNATVSRWAWVMRDQLKVSMSFLQIVALAFAVVAYCFLSSCLQLVLFNFTSFRDVSRRILPGNVILVDGYAIPSEGDIAKEGYHFTGPTWVDTVGLGAVDVTPEELLRTRLTRLLFAFFNALSQMLSIGYGYSPPMVTSEVRN